MSTPLASKTTVSSRNKMALLSNIGTYQHHTHRKPPSTTIKPTIATTTTTTTSRLAPRTTIKPLTSRSDRLGGSTNQVPATSSRIAVPRSRLTGSGAGLLPPPTTSRKQVIGNHAKVPSFADSRSSSKLSSISPINNNDYYNHRLSRQTSVASSIAPSQTSMKKPSNFGLSYVPDTNVVRKGLAKFSNPIECQRQFQALNSTIRELKEINENKEKDISKLQDQLEKVLNSSVGYAITVQYFAKKLKLDSEVDLETQCEQLKSRVEHLLANERDYENKLESIVDDYKNHLQIEQDLRNDINRELKETKAIHEQELVRLKDEHTRELDDLIGEHSKSRSELQNRIEILESELKLRCKELADLHVEHDTLNNNFNKLEESLTKDKNARVKYAQEKAQQLQKDVESLESVLEMKTEKIHALEKDSILLGEAQHEIMVIKDRNKALQQQIESMEAALEKKREEFENLVAEHDTIVQELKRERKERRRMTMRTEQLEFVLNESCATENNITVLDSSVRTMDTSVDRVV